MGKFSDALAKGRKSASEEKKDIKVTPTPRVG